MSLFSSGWIFGFTLPANSSALYISIIFGSLGLIFLYCLAYLTYGHCLPNVYMSKDWISSHWNWEKVLDDCKTLKSRYWATWWAFSFQTGVMGVKCILWRNYSNYQSEEFELEDGESVNFDWFISSKHPPKPETPIIVVLHGVVGETTDYIDLGEITLESGEFRTVVLNRRGHGSRLRRPDFSIHGDFMDIRVMLEHLHREYPFAPLLGFGFSAGAILLSRYLGEFGKESLISAAVCVSSAFDYETALLNLPRLSGKFLLKAVKHHFIYPNSEVLRSHHPEVFEKICESSDLQEAYNLTAHFSPRNLKLDPKEFRRHSNPILVSDKSLTPTLFVSARNDPIFPGHVLDLAKEKLLQNPMHCLVEMEIGSHVCFFEGWKADRWVIRVALEYFHSALSHRAEKATLE